MNEPSACSVRVPGTFGQQELKARVYSRIQDVPTEHWDALVEGRSCAHSREFWEVVERAGMNDFTYRYAVILDEQGRAAAFASFYRITTDIAIFAPPALRGLLTAIRRVLPRFLTLRMIECGTPITVSSPPFGMRDDVDPKAVIEAITDLLLSIARRERCLIIVVRDFEDGKSQHRRELQRRGYRFVPSLPNTYLDIRWPDPQAYLDAMRSYYRSKLMRYRKRSTEAGIRHELVDDFHDLADKLCAQWTVVHEHAAEFQRERLTPTFYRELSRRMGSRAKALLFYRRDELVGHALLLLDGDMLRWLYVGRNEAHNDGLYIRIAQQVVETAILLGAKTLEMGLTTYPVKQDLGAKLVPNSVALRSSLGVVDPFITLVYGLLNRTPRIENREVFKAPDGQRTPTMRRRKNR